MSMQTTKTQVIKTAPRWTGCHVCGRDFARGEVPAKAFGEYAVHADPARCEPKRIVNAR